MEIPVIKLSDRYASYIQPILLLAVDYLAILLAEECSFQLRELIIAALDIHRPHLHLRAHYFYFVLPLTFIVFLHWGRTYIRLLSIGEMFRKTFYSILTAIVVSIIVLFLLNKTPTISRLVVTLLGAFVFCFVCLGRLLLRSILNHFNLFLEPTIFIGSGVTARKVINYSANSAFFGIRVVGVIDDKPSTKTTGDEIPVLGPTSEALEIIKQTKVDNILIITSGMQSQRLNAMVDSILPLVKNVSFVPTNEEMPVSNMEMHRLYSENIVVLSIYNNLARWYNMATKRAFDLIGAILGTIVISPLLFTIAVLIKLESKGPAFYTHIRIGRNGKAFRCIKFRSMVDHADQRLSEYLKNNDQAREEWESNYKLKDDPRITKFGSFLRRTSLDELPQLFNVIIGQMSLVGPRPITKEELHKYGSFANDYKLVRPGMTGLWQTSGRSNTSYDNRIRLDAWYVRNWNLWLDIGILTKTVKVLLSKTPGAY